MTTEGTTTPGLTPEARGDAPGLGRMAGRRILVVGAGQTDYHMEDQPIGNGRAIALLLAREGARVVAVDVDKAAADGTVELITAAGGEATALVIDVADPSQIEEMVERARDWLGGLDGVVYNVGIPGPVGLFETTAEGWDNTLNVNLRGIMLTARAAMPVMEPASAFVFISSIAARSAGGGLMTYAVSKSGMESLMRHIATAGKDRSIRANIVMPGRIDTGLARNHNNQTAAQIGSGVPIGRAGTGWDIAYATLFLLSDESTYVTAQILAVDGGSASF